MHVSHRKCRLFAALQLADPTDPTGHRVQTGVHTSQESLSCCFVLAKVI